MIEFAQPYRDIYIALDAMQLLIAMQISTGFFTRMRKDYQIIKDHAGWGFIFAGFALMQLMGIIIQYFATYGDMTVMNTIFSILLYIIVTGIIAMFEFFMKKRKDTHYLIALIAVITFVISQFIIGGTLGRQIFVVYFMILFVYTLIFFVTLARLASGQVRINMILFALAFYVLIFGNSIITENAIQNQIGLGMNYLIVGLIGRILKIASFLSINALLMALPIFLEVNWKQNLLQIMVIHRKMGVAINNTVFHKLYDRVIANEHTAPAEDLVAGGMIGITTMLKEISQSTTELRIIDHGDLKILLEHGSDIIIALSVKDEMHIFHEKLKALRDTFDQLYGSSVANWDGNLRFFDPVQSLVKTIFEMNK